MHEYYVASSHNSYLQNDQLAGHSSAEMYAARLVAPDLYLRPDLT